MHARDKTRADYDAIKLLEQARAELAEIHRGKHYALWCDDRRQSLGNALIGVEFTGFGPLAE
jgi:hypothetical protein